MMRHTTSLIALVTLACGAPPPEATDEPGAPASRMGAQQDDVASGIAERSAAFDRAFNAADLGGIAALVTDDFAFITAAGGGGPGGKEAFVAGNRELFAERPGVTMLHEIETIEVGPLPWGIVSERGRWTERWLQDDKEVVLGGTYLSLWHRKNGLWLKAAELLIALRCSGPYCSG